MSLFRPRIAIVGGGPSGLALSQLLRQRNIHSTVHELCAKPTEEDLSAPSGMLDLHADGAQFLTFTIRHVSTKFQHLLPLTGSGAMSALGGGNGLMTHRGPVDSIRLYAAISTPDESWTESAGLSGKTAAEVASKLLGNDQLFGKWAPELQDLLATACEQETLDHPDAVADIKPSYMLLVGHIWEHCTGATLIGDAAHPMTPWAGEGVNLALWDALDLSHVLSSILRAWRRMRRVGRKLWSLG